MVIFAVSFNGLNKITVGTRINSTILILFFFVSYPVRKKAVLRELVVDK